MIPFSKPDLTLTCAGRQGKLPAMRIVFMGTGDIAIPAFRSLIRHSDLAGLVTQPDRPVGRHQVLTAPAIKNIAREAGIPVLQPHSLRSPDALSNLRRLNPDLIVVMAYGQILSQEVIDMAPMGCINAHASLLPRHRGAACIQSAIKSGDAETGITIVHIVRKLDAGDIIAQISTPLEGTETGGSLHDKLARMTPDVLLPVIHSIEKGTATRIRQQEILATYAPKLLRADGKIDWTRPAEEIGRMIRAYDPWPGTFTNYWNRKKRIRNMKIFPGFSILPEAEGKPGQVLSAGEQGLLIACGSGGLLVTDVQLEGSTRMNISQLIAGHPNLKDIHFDV